MDISFIIPIYNNSDKELTRLIRSVKLLDSNINYEIILVDDGSKESLSTVYKNISLTYEVTYFKKVNAGVSEARNYGLKQSKGKYIIFLDADDQFVASNFSLPHEEKDIIIYNIERVNIENHKTCILDIDKQRQQLNSTYLLSCILKDGLFNFVTGKIYLREFLEKNKIEFNKNMTVGEDLDFVSRILLLNPSIEYIPKVLYRYLFTVNTGIERIRQHPLQNLNDAIQVYKLRKKILNKINLMNMRGSNVNLNDALIDDIFEIYSQYLNDDLQAAKRNKTLFINVIKQHDDLLGKKTKLKAKLIAKNRYHIISIYLKVRYLYKKIKA